ncbi:MAG TPA: permease [Rickettsiales bacterium]|nr:permease [Rickettsiales bacterium]
MLEYFTKLADYTTFNLLNLENGTKIADAVHFFIEDTTKIFFLTALIIFVMGLFKRSLSQEKVRNYLTGKPKWVGYALAVILGWITPFCSCSSIPLFVGFLKAGIPLSICITFFAVSPMPIEAIAILGSLIGFVPSMIYMVLCGISGVIFGIMTEKFGWEKYVDDMVKDKKQPCSCKNINNTKAGFRGRIDDAIDDVKDILGQIWLWIFLGITAGAFMHGFIPQELFTDFALKYKFLSVPVAVILGTPLYANATGVIPVMQTLFMKGVPLGTVLTFMMSITTLSIPQIMILRKILKKDMLIRFAIFLGLSFMVIGLLFNLFYN